MEQPSYLTEAEGVEVTARRPHITETEAYWRNLAGAARHRARADRRRPGGSIEQIRMNEAYAVEYDQKADEIAAATGSAK